MITVGQILTFLNTLAPPSMKMDWDNVGLLCGDKNTPVTKILVALDPFYHVCREAEEIGAQLIVTHHPIIFRPLTHLTAEDATSRGIMLLCSKGISAINAHTNLDQTPGGVNDALAAALGLRDVQVLNPAGTDDMGRPWGLLRVGAVAKQPLEEFLRLVKERLGCPGLRYTQGEGTVHRVAVGGGSCGSELPLVAAAGCDTFVTADVKYNDFWLAQEQGIHLIDAGHFYTENPVCTLLQRSLQEKFPELSVVLSQSHRDCTNFFL